MEADMKDVLDHVPALVKAYGRWPSFALLVFVFSCQALLALAVLMR
jgi:hypothetical protein